MRERNNKCTQNLTENLSEYHQTRGKHSSAAARFAGLKPGGGGINAAELSSELQSFVLTVTRRTLLFG